MTSLDHLFRPGHIGRVAVRNRIVMPAIQTRGADDEGYVTDRLLDYYAERAKGGAGLIIVQQSAAWPEARLNRGLGVWDDKFLPGLTGLAQAIRRHGAAAALQLGARGTNNDRGLPNIAPSALPSAAHPETVPHALSRDEINSLVEAFSDAARRLREAGFDAVEIHGAHGHLVSQFLSPHTNRRTDEYGGSVENRTRFACRLLSGIREKAGEDFPIIFRMNGDDCIQGGITLEDALLQARLIAAAGADCLHVSATAHDTNWMQQPSYLSPPEPLIRLAEAVRKAVSVPVIAVGKIGEPAAADRILGEGKADFVAMGRALVADPHLPRKAREQRFEDIRRCLYCKGCQATTSIFGDPGGREDPGKTRLRDTGISCTVNPHVLREKVAELRPAASAKRIMVVGGGLAGMEAARTAAERGHTVSLYEKSHWLGGQWRIACMQAGKESWSEVIVRLRRGMTRAGVSVFLDTEVTKEVVLQQMPHAVVVATGAVPETLPVPGNREPCVVQAVDVIQGSAHAGDRVVVVGGRHIGMEVAVHLAETGRKVFLVTRSQLGRGVQKDIKTVLRNRLVELGVQVFSNSPVLEIKPHRVFVSHERSLLVLQGTVVLAVGAKAVNHLARELQGLIPELYSIGDCREPRDAMEAIFEGNELGSRI